MINGTLAEGIAGIVEGIDGNGKQLVFGAKCFGTEYIICRVRNMLVWLPAGAFAIRSERHKGPRQLFENKGIPKMQITEMGGYRGNTCVGQSQHTAGEAMAHTARGQIQKFSISVAAQT